MNHPVHWCLLVFCALVVVYILAVNVISNATLSSGLQGADRRDAATNKPAGINANSRNIGQRGRASTKTRGNGDQYYDIDLMSLPTYKFEPSYKNPCWKVNGTLRCLPYFFLVGVRKCGTSELYKLIAKHPDYIIPQGRKELGWFAEGRFKKDYAAKRMRDSIYPHYSFDFYIDLFSQAAARIDKERKREQRLGKMALCQIIAGDGSPSNLDLNEQWPFLPGNEGLTEPRYINLDYIHHMLPKAKIIVIYREPVERMYSDYYHVHKVQHTDSTSSPKHFHKEATECLYEYRKCLESRTVRSCVYEADYNKYWNSRKWDAAFCGVRNAASHLGLCCLPMSDKKDASMSYAWNRKFQLGLQEATECLYEYRKCLETRTLRSCVYKADYNKYWILRHGIYIVYWQDLVRVFPREQILVVHTEELRDTRSVLHKVFTFLEMRIPNSTEWESFVAAQFNSRRPGDVKKGNMMPRTRALLENFYRPYNEEMYRATSDNTFLYNY